MGWDHAPFAPPARVLALGLPATAFIVGWALIAAGIAVHDWIGQGIGICLASTTLAWRDLVDHVRAVSRALKSGSLERARQAVGLIVGRDTQDLSEQEVVRAAVETTAESACDGVIAPLLFLVVGGRAAGVGLQGRFDARFDGRTSRRRISRFRMGLGEAR